MKSDLYRRIVDKIKRRLLLGLVMVGLIVVVSYFHISTSILNRSEELVTMTIYENLVNFELSQGLDQDRLKDQAEEIALEANRLIDEGGTIGIKEGWHDEVEVVIVDYTYQIISANQPNLIGVNMKEMLSTLNIWERSEMSGADKASSGSWFMPFVTHISNQEPTSVYVSLTDNREYAICVSQPIGQDYIHLFHERLLANSYSKSSTLNMWFIKGEIADFEQNLSMKQRLPLKEGINKVSSEGNRNSHYYIVYKSKSQTKNDSQSTPPYIICEIIFNRGLSIWGGVLLSSLVIVVLIGLYFIIKTFKPQLSALIVGVPNGLHKASLHKSSEPMPHEIFILEDSAFDVYKQAIIAISNLHTESELLLEAEAKRSDQLQLVNQSLEDKHKALIKRQQEAVHLQKQLENSLIAHNKASYSAIRALTRAIEYKDVLIHGHSERVERLSRQLGIKMGLKAAQIETLTYGALLHDVGKLGLLEEVLKTRGYIDPNIYHQIQNHAQIGFDIVRDLHFLKDARLIVLQHHERFDGKGYPLKLKGEAINLLARIVCVCDAYDAMTTDRCYRQLPLTHEQAIDEILSSQSKQFDPKVVQAFVEMLNERGVQDEGSFI